jgi:hypothetical protein
VLVLINELNRRRLIDASGRLPDVPAPAPPVTPPPFYDVNGDGFLTAAGDVLRIINFLNRSFAGEGEAVDDRNARLKREWLAELLRSNHLFPWEKTGPQDWGRENEPGSVMAHTRLTRNRVTES